MEKFFLESKHADVKAKRNDEDFSYIWRLGDGWCLQVEYLPSNYPPLCVYCYPEDELDETIETLKEIGFTVE